MRCSLPQSLASGLPVPAAIIKTPLRSSQQWKMSWRDEFNGPAELGQYIVWLEMFARSKGKLEMTARLEPFIGADRTHESSTEE